tara:strand:- start:3172 stop:3987 length:816 start_codon:yes stop_codon:yes gene_type:complete
MSYTVPKSETFIGAQEQLAQIQLQEKKASARFNTIYLIAFFICCLIVACTYAYVLIEHPENLKNKVKKRYSKNDGVKIIVDVITPLASGLLSILPTILILKNGLSKTVDNERTTKLGISMRVTRLLFVVVITISGLILPYSFMLNENLKNAVMPQKNKLRKKMKELLWCIFSLVVGCIVLILMNMYALRNFIIGATIATSLSGTFILKLLSVLGVTFTATSVSTIFSMFVENGEEDILQQLENMEEKDLKRLNKLLQKDTTTTDTIDTDTL